jgi:hypothetical protein
MKVDSVDHAKANFLWGDRRYSGQKAYRACAVMEVQGKPIGEQHVRAAVKHLRLRTERRQEPGTGRLQMLQMAQLFLVGYVIRLETWETYNPCYATECRSRERLGGDTGLAALYRFAPRGADTQRQRGR